MNTKHTGGKWDVTCTPTSDAYNIRYIVDEKGDRVADICSGYQHIGDNFRTQDEALANAALIAAAPVMLDALKDAETFFLQSGAPLDLPVLKSIKAAISKATGGN